MVEVLGLLGNESFEHGVWIQKGFSHLQKLLHQIFSNFFTLFKVLLAGFLQQAQRVGFVVIEQHSVAKSSDQFDKAAPGALLVEKVQLFSEGLVKRELLRVFKVALGCYLT